MIYRDHVFVDIEEDKDYGLPLLREQPMAQLFGQIGKFDNYSNLSVMQELQANLLGERRATKTMDRESLNKKMKENILQEMQARGHL